MPAFRFPFFALLFVVTLWLSAGIYGSSSLLHAAPGDTTWVQTFTYGWPVEPGWNSPRKGTFWFPTSGKHYEKVLLYYTLKCDPAQNPKCGEWDYLTYTRLHHPTGRVDTTGTPIVESFELGRFITPYGINLDMGTGWTWVWDVSDFVPLLKDSVVLTAGNFQELLDMKFAFIEGTPPREVLSIENLWNGDYPLKDFASKVAPKTITISAETKMVRLRTCVTGHQFDNATNCAEFCPKMHSVDVNGQRRFNWQIVQECSTNPLYPQGGTWIFDRAGWCPGMPGALQLLELTPYIESSTFTVDYNSEYDEFGNYVVASQLVSYSAPNFQNDAAIDEILSPSDEKLMNRSNPICGRPTVRIRNTGARPLTSLTIRYGVRGGQTASYRWTGNLGFLESQTVALPPMDLRTPTSRIFDVAVEGPNEANDEYAANNALSSSFTAVPSFSKTLIVYLRTNNAPTENRYEIKDAQGTVVRSKGGFQSNTFYTDSLFLPDGCYEFIMYDYGDDGLSFFANNDGTGSLRIRISGSGNAVSFNPDFGREARFAFTIATATGMEEPVRSSDFALYPQPASSRLGMQFTLEEPGEAWATLYDLSGRVVRSISLGRLGAGRQSATLDVEGIPAGIHLLTLTVNGRVHETMRVRIGS